jgi:demethylmenaquinone methyltransferase / 2-methoxy-6-polyprenyl-1,4-benzoquinol methylase
VIAELSRILKAGGLGVFLDFSKPRSRFLQRLEYGLLKVWTGFWGILFHRNPEVYGYIAESLCLYPDRYVLKEIMRNTGFSILSSRLYFFGIIELLLIRKNSQQTHSATN